MLISNTSYSMAPIPAGHRIPNELLREIARQADQTGDESFHRPLGKFQELSLVCRDWAHTIRPKRWQVVSLSSRKRLQSFVSLLTTGLQLLDDSHRLQHLGQIIDRIHLDCNVASSRWDPAWTHLVHQMLKPPLTAASVTGKLAIYSSGYKGDHWHWPSFQSFYNNLPHPIPGSFNFIKDLELGQAHIPNRKTLLKALSHLRALEQLQCALLTWEASDLPPVTCALTTTLRCVKVYCIDATSANSAGWWLAPLVGHRFPATSRPARAGIRHLSILGESDYHAMEAMVRFLEYKMNSSVVYIRRESLDHELSRGEHRFH